MKQILIVSNRLPVNISLNNSHPEIKPSVGGLATGMSSVKKFFESKWIGWSGINLEDVDNSKLHNIKSELEKINCIPVYLSENDIENYYHGFSNRTIWPLYHYFTQYTEYEKTTWESYVNVNRIFADEVLKNLENVDILWIHDYHLQLLPQMIREKRPDLPIGYFLHIPFPSFEVFRGLPWRKEIVEGLLGADLIGFHTYDYERHFISSVKRLLGYDSNINQIELEKRTVTIDTFPMGIDYKKYYDAAISFRQKSKSEKTKMELDIDKYIEKNDVANILSIDRLDYTKGIGNRLKAFEYFLNKYPQFTEKVTLFMLSVPSREDVAHYQLMKSEVDELVGKINGKYSTISWTPVHYFYRSLEFDSLVALYCSCNIALITPIRDGMNLVAKEFIATRTDHKGVIILSELAGAAKELNEGLIINPNNFEEIADAIKDAILMSEDEQTERISVMQKRIQTYNIERWTNDFINSLVENINKRQKIMTKQLSQNEELMIISEYNKASERILFLDYDGTLVGFKSHPKLAVPDEELYEMLDKIASVPENKLVLVSGRQKEYFDKWFGNRNYWLIAEHGVWLKKPSEEWTVTENADTEWKQLIRPLIEFYVDRTPGSFIEEKNYTLAWHYRNSDPELGNVRKIELKTDLTGLIANNNLELLEGNKVLEVKNGGINKGRTAANIISAGSYDFIVGIGDDITDEYLFSELPPYAHSIKVGAANTKAKFTVDTHEDVRRFLKKLTDN